MALKRDLDEKEINAWNRNEASRRLRHYDSFLDTPLETVLSRHFERAPEQAALALFHTVAATVPAYRAFLAEQAIDPSAIQTVEDFKTVPAITKQNYQSRYPLADLCRDGRAGKLRFYRGLIRLDRPADLLAALPER